MAVQFFNAHVIEQRANVMLKAIGVAYLLPEDEIYGAIAAAEKAADYKHGWYFDVMAGGFFKNDGGRGIVWAEQPIMD